MTDNARLQTVLDMIDAANNADPTIETTEETSAPAALLYGRRMSEVLNEFAPDAPELLQIAVRAQHIERWKRKRSDYPEGKPGYLQWRRDAAIFHGERTSALMQQAGYDEAERDRVALLLSKKAIKKDPDAQTLEDVACLVFMRWYFGPFAATRSDDELFQIVQKTARKMSPKGRETALTLPLPANLVPAVTSAG